jgi:hydroxymethylbilane synthase
MRLATRSSSLALAQARLVAAALQKAELVEVREAAADRRGGDKARFVRGVEESLLSGRADLGVHSAKDLPAEVPEGLALVGVFEREEPKDVYVGEAATLGEVPEGARIGTASLRRRAQLLALRPDLEVVPLRGNVDTRLRKRREQNLDGIVLAAAGLRRLGRTDEVGFAFGLDELTPAAGQGALALEARVDDVFAASAAAGITDHASLVELTAERAAIASLGASCDTPIGICARHEAEGLRVLGFAGLPDGSEWVRDGVAGSPEQPGALGEALAERMLRAGAGELLERAAAESVGGRR